MTELAKPNCASACDVTHKEMRGATSTLSVAAKFLATTDHLITISAFARTEAGLPSPDLAVKNWGEGRPTSVGGIVTAPVAILEGLRTSAGLLI